MRSKISILISTNRPYENFAKRVVDGLCSQDMSENEIIICGTEEILDPRIKFIKDTVCINGPQGFNQAAKASQGDYLVVLTDDHHPPRNINDVPALLNNDYFKDKRYRIATAQSGGVCHTGDGCPRYLMCRFPVLTRDCFKELGEVIFHPNFNLKSPYYADCFLSYFLGVNNNEAIEVNLELSNFQSEMPQYVNNSFKEECREILLKLVSSYIPGESYLSV
jgi:hypothetical protein